MKRTIVLPAIAALLAGCSAGPATTGTTTTTTVTVTRSLAEPSTAEAAAPASTGRITKQIGEEMGIYPDAQGSANGPATATGTITEIKKSRSKFTGGFALRVSATVRTGSDDETNAAAMRLWWCGSGSWSTLDPATGEQLSGHGGMMIKGENHITSFARGKTYSCTFDADGLADHGLLILGGLTDPSTYAISFDVR
ncbi:hypothetical protein [Amycolatopsis sp. SID8362]|uniref:hypothetical protein n=1 Tax=Amycolatopsis sp. SID8362 TaxID=2690346 RepID=UPI001367FA98|nr:hypothetical protein [Amycolatopsis sp. SID8362]NBH09561.1 hypothetical protein [Amycolatopsis sp. SID8362]NED46253.1 hypothetical protein [Amycolatopsis sp. SID8362]